MTSEDTILAANLKHEENEVQVAERELEFSGWNRHACDDWEDPITGLRYHVLTAYAIMNQRKRRIHPTHPVTTP